LPTVAISYFIEEDQKSLGHHKNHFSFISVEEQLPQA
jgi:hypothetical protein